MAEKILHEVRFIETDDGFRIEYKGDKERMRKMGFGPGMRFGRHGHGPWKHWRGHGFGPWMWGCWSGEFEEDDEDEKKTRNA
jgi:hypothetical protein